MGAEVMVQHVAGSGCGGDPIVWKNYGIGLMKFLWQQDPPDVVSRPTKFKIYPFCLPTMQGRRTRVPGVTFGGRSIGIGALLVSYTCIYI